MPLTGLRRSSRTVRMLLLAVATATLVVLIGATYQGVATAVERHRFPRPGGLVDVGGHQLHIYCTGAGSPLVVLEASSAGLSSAWESVQRRVAMRTRVCSYDRAGLGWSEAGTSSFDAARVPQELHALVENARERAPFVLAGHGLGAAYAVIYASRYRADIAALVLIDEPSTSPDDDRIRTTRLIRTSPWLARFGVLRAGSMLSDRAKDLGGDAGQATRAFLNRPDHLTRAAQELSQMEATLALAEAQTLDSSLPIIRVGAGSTDPVALLISADQANRAAGAIATAIERVRRSDTHAQR